MNIVWFSEKYVSVTVVVINFVLVEVIERAMNWLSFINRTNRAVYKLEIMFIVTLFNTAFLGLLQW